MKVIRVGYMICSTTPARGLVPGTCALCEGEVWMTQLAVALTENVGGLVPVCLLCALGSRCRRMLDLPGGVGQQQEQQS